MKKLQFEVKFYSSEFEWSFPATCTFSELRHRIEGYYTAVTYQYSYEGFNVLSDGEYVGTIKPAYPEANKINWLHELFREEWK